MYLGHHMLQSQCRERQPNRYENLAEKAQQAPKKQTNNDLPGLTAVVRQHHLFYTPGNYTAQVKPISNDPPTSSISLWNKLEKQMANTH